MLLGHTRAFLFTGVTRLHPLSRARDTTISIRSLKTMSFTSTPCHAIASTSYLTLASNPANIRFRFVSLGGTIGP